MIINLNEIPEAGQTYNYNSTHREMAAALQDLVQGGPFEINLFILPAGNAFDVRGTLSTEVPSVCSFCATDFRRKVNEKFHEILLIGDKTRCNLKVEDAEMLDPSLNVTSLPNYEYDVGEHLHEILAITEPTQPACRQDCKGLCSQCGSDLNQGLCGCRPEPKTKKENAFSVLKNLKLN